MATKNKRINLPKDTYMFKGPMGNMVYLEAYEIWLRGMDEKDMLRTEPTVMLVPIGRGNKTYHDFSFDIRGEDLEEFIQTLCVMQGEIEAHLCEVKEADAGKQG